MLGKRVILTMEQFDIVKRALEFTLDNCDTLLALEQVHIQHSLETFEAADEVEIGEG